MTPLRVCVRVSLAALPLFAGTSCARGDHNETVLRVMAWAGPEERRIEQRIIDRFVEKVFEIIGRKRPQPYRIPQLTGKT